MTLPPLIDRTPIKPRTGAERHHRYNRSAKGLAREKRRQEKEHKVAIMSFEDKPFIAWDGEGVTRNDGTHVYNLLANSLGDSLKDTTGDGLNTFEIFEFVIDVTRNVKGIHILYGGNYDWNMWIANLRRFECEKLYKKGHLFLGDNWQIGWKPNKDFYIAHREWVNGERKKTGSAHFYDIMPFFQTSFVKACDSYLGDSFIERDLVVAGKAGRASFTFDDLENVERYNDIELQNLVLLATELRSRLNRVGLRPRRWDGPGAVAMALLGRYHIKERMAETPKEVQEAAQYAYAGGRFESVKCGVVSAKRKEPWQYDINSAYPYALTHLPDLANGKWVHHSSNVKPPVTGNEFTVYRLQYSAIDAEPGFDVAAYSKALVHSVHPFFYRSPKGGVSFPPQVEGWYWAPDVYAGIRYAKKNGYRVTLFESWEFVPNTEATKPFSFIPELFAQREALKKAGDGAHVGIKLGLNSIYGKIVQQIGWRENDDGSVRIPPYHQLEWGGWITSHCRGSIFNILIDNDATDDVIAFETDAVFVTRKLEKIPLGTGLGEWEPTIYNWLCYCQSGFYFGRSGETIVNKTRGVDKGTVTFDDIKSAYLIPASQFPSKIDPNDPSTYRHIVAPLTRFIGLGFALQGDWSKWRSWQTQEKTIAVVPSTGKRIHKTCRACHRSKNRGFPTGLWHPNSLPLFSKMPKSNRFPLEWLPDQPDMPDLEDRHDEWRRMERFDE